MKAQTRSNPSVLVGWDPADRPTDALRWAVRTAQDSDQRVVLFSAYAQLRESLSPETYRAARTAHDAAASRFADELIHLGTGCTYEPSNDDLRVSMLDVAERHGSQLIVVGASSTSTGPGLLHLGSATEFLAHHSDRPLAVIRSPLASPEHLAVAVDGTNKGLAALRWAEARSRFADVNVESVNVEPGRRSASQLIARATEMQADLIVVGTPRVGDILGRRFGGTAITVLHDTSHSIVLVPAGTDS